MTSLTATTNDQEVLTETEETYAVSNSDFLRAVFGDLPDKVRPMVVSFAGNPSTVNGSAWAGKSWVESDSELQDARNNYFSLSAFRPDEDGQYRRRKEQFYGCFAIMLDDIGTKVEEVIELDPSWIIETSEGNYQVGYILVEPILEIGKANQLVDAIVEAGFCDPGAKGPSTRLARLPVALNGKHDPEFNCRLVRWQPRMRYSLAELVDGLGLCLSPPPKKGPKQVPIPRGVASNDDAVWTPKPTANPVIEALIQKGLYKSLIQEGKHEITCPWVDEHTDSVDGGTAYFEPDENWATGGFSCLHGHCAGRSIRDLLAVFQIPEHAARMKSVIRVVEGGLDKVVDAAERVLAERGNYYQRGGKIVTIYTDPGRSVTQIVDVGVEALTMELARFSDWLRFDGRSKSWVNKDPSTRHVNTLYKNPHYQHIPVLTGLARQPYLRDDLSLVSDSGYDSSSRTYGAFNPQEYVIPEAPTPDEARSALGLLNELLDEFEFVDESDRAAALCAMLTASVRPSLPTAPMFHVKAHAPGSGKSYLCALISCLAAQNIGQPTSFPDDEEECRKLLFAEFLRSPAVLEFDNITTDLRAHKSLCSALTAEVMSGRVLGQSTTMSVSTRTLFLSSGNNVGPVADMIRRCMTVGLTCSTDHPAQRTFKHPNLLGEVRQKRSEYVSAALTIIRAWIEAGKPMQQINHLSGYDMWSSLCRQSLVWLGCPDPAGNLFRNMTEDPEREVLGRLFDGWSALFGSRPLKVRDVLERVTPSDPQTRDFAELLEDIAGDHKGAINARSLGRWVAKHAGRIVDGRQLVKMKASTAGDTWAVKGKV